MKSYSRKIFDTNNMNDNNYYHFDEGNPVYVIIYPLLRYESEMITETQLNYMRKFQKENKIFLWDEDRMYTYVTRKLASLIIQRLEKGEEIRFAFSKQEENDFVDAVEKLKTKFN